MHIYFFQRNRVKGRAIVFYMTKVSKIFINNKDRSFFSIAQNPSEGEEKLVIDTVAEETSESNNHKLIWLNSQLLQLVQRLSLSSHLKASEFLIRPHNFF